ncbi:MAG TPA: DMT family transporter [Xanthobacteraceae bacterium]|nr:DMT family transporter [Xanthobacteraceae bacterium]
MNPTHLGRVVFWMTGALLSFSASAVAVRELAPRFNIFEILACRTGFGFVVMAAITLSRPSLRAQLNSQHLVLHGLRNTIHFVGQYTWAWAITLLPLATVFALEFTMPMWVALLAIPLLGERMTPTRAGSIVLGFIGVLVIVRPGLASFKPAAMLVLVAALAFALSLIATKSLTNKVSTFVIIFWMNAMQLPIALAGSDPLFVLRFDTHTAMAAATFGIVGLTSHYCLTNAFRWGDATIVVPIDFMRIPLIAFVGWMVYGEPLDVLVFAGAGLIICGVLWNLHAESRRVRAMPLAD